MTKQRFTHLLIVVLLLASCAKRASVKPPERHRTFIVETVDSNTVLVIADGPKGDADAKEYLCTKSYICTREDFPVHVFKLTRVRK